MARAVIAGGGIGGAVAAVALARAGIVTEVLERYDHGADGVGGFLTFAVNGIAALETMGLRHLVEQRGFDTPAMRLQNHRGRHLLDVPIGGRLADGTVGQTLLRSDLYRALRDEAERAGARVSYGREVVGAEESRDGVEVVCADGTRIAADALIGADGLRSRVRTLIDPDAPQATYQGLLNTGGIARGVEVDSPVGTMVMSFGRRCAFAWVRDPDGAVWWFANPVRRAEPSTAELRRLRATFRADLVADLAGDGTPAAALVAATEKLIDPYGTYYFPTVPTWHTDRMLIVGDAAHAVSPASGQGASMAIEDAVVLGQCLRDASGPDRFRSAFAAFERARRPRVEAVVAQGRRNGDGKTAGPVGRVLRDLFMRQVLRRIVARDGDPQAWMTGYRIDWDAPATIGPAGPADVRRPLTSAA